MTRGKAKAAKATAVTSTVLLSCCECDGNINCTERSLYCDICSNSYHTHCVGMDDKVYDIFIDIRDITGWVCCSCRSDSTSKLNKLQAAQASLAVEISEIKSNLNAMSSSSSDAANNPSVSPMCYAAALKSSVVKEELHREVRTVIRDTDRRGRNIIISGLQSIQNSKDEEIVMKLFEQNMPLKPVITDGCCKRIGKPVQGLPLKLRVTLDSAESVSLVLKAAKSLRTSTDSQISSSVYINKDLSPEELKTAYELRVKKRAEKLVQGQGSSVHMTSGPTAGTSGSVAAIQLSASSNQSQSNQSSSSQTISSSGSNNVTLPSTSSNTASASN